MSKKEIFLHLFSFLNRKIQPQVSSFSRLLDWDDLNHLVNSSSNTHKLNQSHQNSQCWFVSTVVCGLVQINHSEMGKHSGSTHDFLSMSSRLWSHSPGQRRCKSPPYYIPCLQTDPCHSQLSPVQLSPTALWSEVVVRSDSLLITASCYRKEYN